MKSFPNRIRLQVPSLAVSIATLSALVPSERAGAQGCVAVRGCSITSQNHALNADGVGLTSGTWMGSIGYRFFESDRHFSGSEESRNAQGLTRKEQGNEVINDSHFIDLSVTYQITPRWSATASLPFVHHTRSAPYEHSGVRHETSSGGLADARASIGAWLLDPSKPVKGNVQLALGFKAPTGDYDVTDTFYQKSGDKILPVIKAVDQSIQPGDGGWGVTFDLNGYYEIVPRLFAYGQVYYLFNPQNVNGVKSPTARRDAGPTLNGVDIDNGMSITDQYLFRTGLTYVISKKHHLTASLGGRMEGVPVEDLNGNAGDEEGFRRPGFAIAIEPGINWMPGKWNVSFAAPVRVAANRERSYWDIEKGRHGDAAFADYLLTFSVTRFF